MENKPHQQALRIGITGGIGSGKSRIAEMLEAMDYPVYYADDRAKALMAEDQELRQQIGEHFGQQAYHPDGSLNRAFLSEEAFSNPEQTRFLNELVHPAVGRDFEAWCQERTDAGFLFMEAALMIESGRYKSLDQILLIWAPDELRLQRVLARDPQRSESQVRAIMERQMPEKDKKQYADCVLLNDGRHLLLPQLVDYLENCPKPEVV